MNERLQLLAEQAKDYADYYSMLSDSAEQEIFTEKFAELIVRECIAQCAKNVDHEYLGWGSKLSAFNIKQHFGVEE
jgi:uncharacterized membrane-anchored protein YhcB (DUF1043 family)